MTKHEAIQAMELIASIAEHMAKRAHEHPEHSARILKVSDELRAYVARYRKLHNL